MDTIIPHTLSTTFEEELRTFLGRREGDVRRIYSDDKGIPTMGVGFALFHESGDDYVYRGGSRDALKKELEGFEIFLTDADLEILDLSLAFLNANDPESAIALIPKAEIPDETDGAYVNPEKNAFSFELITSQVDGLLNLTLVEARKELKSRIGAALYDWYDGSKEMVALLSLAFNHPDLIGPKLVTALQNDDRAEAWFQIRYQSNGDGINGTRRYHESDQFGLYNESPGEDEYRSVLQMYTFHREDILYTQNGIIGYEQKYDPPTDGLYSSISEAIRPATEDFARLYGEGGTIDGEVLVGEDISRQWLSERYAYWSEDDTLTGTDTNDLLMGESGADTLHGGLGDDVLYGGAGKDRLYGGEGFDTYVHNTGDGVSIIEDSDGQGRIIWDGVTVAGGERTSLDANVKAFLDASGTYYVYDEGTDSLFLKRDGTNELVEIENHTSGTVSLAAFEVGSTQIETSGNLGMSFADAGAVQYTNLIEGDPLAEPVAQPTVDGTEQNDEIYTYGGLDAISAGAGDDYVDAGASDDWVYGGLGNDVLHGGDGVDVLYGQEGDDTLYGGAGRDLLGGDVTIANAADGGRDSIFGGADDDFISGLYSDDWLDGGDGTDLIVGGHGMDYLTGGTGDDHLHGDGVMQSVDADWSITYSPDNTRYVLNYTYNGVSGFSKSSGADGSDVIHGGLGNDVITGGGGRDFLYGDEDNDWIEGDGGRDVIDGGSGDDTIHGDSAGDTANGGDDVLRGGLGNDIIEGGIGNDELFGGDGDDELHGDDTNLDALMLGGNDILDGGAGNDDLAGGSGDDTLDGGAGLDFLSGGDGSDVLRGGLDADTLTGDAGDDVLYGDEGDDAVLGGEGADVVHGGDGADVVQGGAGDDVVSGDAGNDNVSGDDGNDRLSGGEGHDDLLGGAGDDILDGGDGDDRLWGESGADVLEGGIGNDQLIGGTEADHLSGGAGADQLWGESGNDTLVGGAGDDVLQGGTGDDRYEFQVGDGADRIWEEGSSSADSLVFADGILPEHVAASRAVNDLILTYGPNDSVRVSNWYASDDFKLSSVQFSDGTVWTQAEVTAAGNLHLVGTEASETIYGTADGQLIEGFGGDDRLYAYGGDDTLRGGAGNDSLFGSSGNDIYEINLGGGHDTIQDGYSSAASDTVLFGAGIAPDNLEFERIEQNLVIRHFAVPDSGTPSESVTIENWYIGTGYQGTQFRFVDQPDLVISAAEASERGINIAHDYRYTVGDGGLIIQDWGGSDTLTFASEIAPGEIAAQRTGSDLVLAHANGIDSVTVKGWFVSLDQQIEEIRFDADGTVWLAQEVTAPLLNLEGTEAPNVLSGSDLYGEVLDGRGGNDELYGRGGNDHLTGGTGNDLVDGGLGNDTYFFYRGDGSDVIYDAGGWDVLKIEGLSPHELTVNWGYDLSFSFATGESIEVQDDAVERIELIQRGTDAAEEMLAADWGGTFVNVIYAGGGADTVYGSDNWDELHGGDGDDVLEGRGGWDTLHGGAGNDRLGTIYATSDTQHYGDKNYYYGGAGDDILYGTALQDTYYFSLGDGSDTIIEQPQDGLYGLASSNQDRIHIQGDVDPDSVNIERVGNSIVIHVSPDDQITVQDWLSYHYRVEYIEFDDGTVWNSATIEAKAFTQVGSAGDDQLVGNNSYADALYGMEGDDVLYGYGGQDLLDGGAGNDTLYGGSDRDFYTFERGYGNDTIIDSDARSPYYYNEIQFGADISLADISYARDADDLVLNIAGSPDDTVTIRNYLRDPDYQQFVLVFAGVRKYLHSDLDPSIVDSLVNYNGTEFDDTLTGSNGYDFIRGYGGNDTLSGLGGDDKLYGGDGSDHLEGGSGSDHLEGGEGDDRIDGGLGNDYLDGGLGNDTYIYAATGVDEVVDVGGIDTISYEGQKASTDLIVGMAWNGTDNYASVDGFSVLGGVDGSVEFYELSDGVFTFDELFTGFAAAGNTINHQVRIDYNVDVDTTAHGTEYNDSFTVTGSSSSSYRQFVTLYGYGGQDILSGSNGADFLYGGEGADRLMGNDGRDHLDGGAGNDVLEGGYGNDTYVFASGYGNDLIYDSLGADSLVFDGVARADVDVYRPSRSDDLVFQLKATGESITIQNWGLGASYQVESVRFADGSVLDQVTLEAADVRGGAKSETLRGSRGADRLFGEGGNDTLLAKDGDDSLDGGAGDDTLDGGVGNDTYLFSGAWGHDSIVESDGTAGNTDVATFGSQLRPEDLLFERDGNSLVVTSLDGGANTVTVQDWYLGADHHVEMFRSADGSILQSTQIDLLLQSMASFVAENGMASWEEAMNLDPNGARAVLATYWEPPSAAA